MRAQTAPVLDAALFDLIDRDTVEQLLDSFANATGLQTLVLDAQGHDQAGTWRNCPACDQLTEQHWRELGELGADPDASTLRCRCGLVGACAAVQTPAGGLLARVLVGPYIAADTDLSTISNWRKRTGIQAGSMEAASRLPRLTSLKSLSIARLIAQTLKMVATEDLLASENARLLHEQREINADLAVRHAVAAALNAELDLTGVLERLVETVGDALRHEVVSVWLVEGDYVVIKASRGMLTTDSKRARLKIGMGVAGRVAATAAPLTCSDIQTDPRLYMRANVSREGIHGQAGVPITLDGEVIGVLCLHQRAPYEYSRAELSLLARSADYAAVAIGRANQYEHERRQVQQVEQRNVDLELQHQLLVRLAGVQDGLTQMVLDGRSLQEMVDRLAGLLDNPVVLYDSRARVLASTLAAERLPAYALGAEIDASPELRVALDQSTRERRPVRLSPRPAIGLDQARLISSVIAGQDLVGYLTVVGERRLNDGDLMLAERASGLVALAMLKERTALEVEYRLKGGLLEDLLTGDPEDCLRVGRRATHLGYDLDVPHVLVICAPRDAAEAQRLEAAILAELGATTAGPPVSLVGYRLDRLVVAVPSESEAGRPLEVAAAVRARASQPGQGGGRIGVSRVCHQPADFAAAFDETCRMLELAQSLRIDSSIVTSGEVRLHRLLLGLSRPAEALALADDILAPLERLDSGHRSLLVQTLEAYLEHNGVVQQAADQLEVHANTVAYRLQRLRSLSGFDLDSAETRLRLQVALHIRRAAAHRSEPG